MKTYERVAGKAGSLIFDVYDPEGVFLAKVPMMINLDRNSVWKYGKLYTIEIDAKGFPVIKRRKVTWKDLQDGER